MLLLHGIVSLASFLSFLEARRLTEAENHLLQRTCGVRAGNRKVLYGQEVETTEAPWAVSITAMMQNGLQTLGTGTLISPRHILTAGHLRLINYSPCDYSPIDYTLNPENLVVFFNTTCSTPNKCARMGLPQEMIYRNVVQMYHPREYIGYTCPRGKSQGDMLIMELDRDVLPNEYLFPACLPDPDIKLYEGLTTHLYGFGGDPSARGEKNAQILKRLDSQIVRCRGIESRSDLDDIICTESESAGLACKGDSGSGVIQKIGGKVEIIGVLSAGIDCPIVMKRQQESIRAKQNLFMAQDIIVSSIYYSDFICQATGVCRKW
ncbi:unnamed protein product [Caenorhabditis auriculariae]|uniref:Peptidase S1 domain-containing protein n=1 Tax=Caenorhabditis auriculariae TaxID=2777116 RepID=A0A8S1H3Q7_9PELO|nr:unnamed protein product [Caenorhabditis auriculariae]